MSQIPREILGDIDRFASQNINKIDIIQGKKPMDMFIATLGSNLDSESKLCSDECQSGL